MKPKKKFSKSRSIRGAALVEYSLLIGLIAVIAVVAVEGLGAKIRDRYESVAETVDVETGGGGQGCHPVFGCPDP